MRATLFVAALVAGALAPPAVVRAEGQRVERLEALHEVCREAERGGRPALVVVEVEDFRFGRYLEDEGLLAIDTRRNLRALQGAVELFPSDLETVGFFTGPEQARELRSLPAGTRLRVGFFLGFDDAGGTLCLIRPAVGVTTVRMDVAFVELLDAGGGVLARQDTERLRSWRDDEELDDIPGEGARGEALPPVLTGRGVAAPTVWREAFRRANGDALGRALRACHEAGVARGGAGRGQVVVRLRVGRDGAIQRSEVELSSLGDRREAACVAEAVGRVALPPASGGPDAVLISVPVRLRN